MRAELFGESHGAAIGVVLTDVPPGIPINMGLIQRDLRRRAPGRSDLSTPRREADIPEILSGVYQGRTTGTPLCAVIRNTDTHSADYDKIKDLARPGHADYTGFVRYRGAADPHGGGHFSGRLTAPLVLAGGIAKAALKTCRVEVFAKIDAIGGIRDDAVDTARPDIDLLRSVAEKPFPTASDQAGQKMQEEILLCRDHQDSVGGEILCLVTGLPAGLGAPDFDRNAETYFAREFFRIPAVKAVAFGDGFSLSTMHGSEANDAFCLRNGKIETVTNHNGGILGGITTGMPVVAHIGIKPTPSIGQRQQTVNYRLREEAEISVPGRHDPCIVHRAVPVAEAAAALASLALLQTEGILPSPKEGIE